MKNYAKIVLALMLVVALFGLVACEIVPGEQHTHTFAKEWTMSETEHWHVATCEHTTEVSDRGPHQFEAKVTKKVTSTEDGEAVYTCTVCGYSKTETLSHTSHEHIIGWTSNRAEHTQAYICCDAKLDNPQHGEHDYSEGATCKICHDYSVVEDAKEQLNNGVFSYSVVVENINLKLSNLTDDSCDLVVNSGAFKVGLDENCMLTLVGKYSGVMSQDVDVAADKTDTAQTNVSGTIVIDNNKVYLIATSDTQNLIIDKSSSSITQLDYTKTYSVYDLNKQFEGIGVDNFSGIVDLILDGAYDYSDEIKSVVDKILSVDTGDNFDTWFVKQEDGSYKLNFGVINDFNDKAKDKTVGDVLADLLGTDNYKDGVENIVKMVLGFKVGDVLDILEQQGVDIYEINDKINELVAKYNPGEEKTIEEILIAQGLPIPANAKLADLIDNKLTRAYTVLDIVNMIGEYTATEEKPFTKLTVDGVVNEINSYLDIYASRTVYQLVAEIVTAALANTDMALTISASNIYTVIDELGNFLQDCLHISVVLKDGKVVSLSLNIFYEAPAEEEPTEEPETTTEDETTTEPSEDEDPMGLNTTIAYVMEALRTTIGENVSVSIVLNDSTVGVDVDAAIAEANKGISDVTPEGAASVKKILEASDYTNVAVTQKDGRDYITADKTSTTIYTNIHVSGDYDDELQITYTVSVGGYVDKLIQSVSLLDKCSDNFAARIDVMFDEVEITATSYLWRKSGKISTEELDALREQYKGSEKQYPLLYGNTEQSDLFEQIECIYDAAAKTYTKCEYNNFDAMENEVGHDYELVSGSLEEVNGNYFTKLVYKCKTCEHTVVIFVRSDVSQSETQTQLAA